MNLKNLEMPFHLDDIEWRVQSSGQGNNGIWARVLAYISSRAVQDRLDDACGPENWKNEFQVTKIGDHSAILCGISIHIENEWVTKWDGAEPTDIEPVKGGLSSSMKRAAVLWGIGRYLYRLKDNWAIIDQDGSQWGKLKDNTRFRWNPPLLPDWALPNKPSPDPATNRNGQVAPERMPDMTGYNAWIESIKKFAEQNHEYFTTEAKPYNDQTFVTVVEEMRPCIRNLMKSDVYRIPDNDFCRFETFNDPNFVKDINDSLFLMLNNKIADLKELQPPPL